MGFGPEFNELLRKKYEILGQQAAADMIRANAAAQDVNQKAGMQGAADTAAMDRARLAAQTQTNVAGINESGAMARTGMTTQAQRDIASQSLGFDREKLAQQGQQFGQTIALDIGKAQETAIQARAELASPQYGTPAFNPRGGTDGRGGMESAVKRPAITGLAPSPLSRLGGVSDLGMESDDDLRKRRAAAMGAR